MHDSNAHTHESSIGKFQYMVILQRVYKAPAALMYDQSVPYHRRVYLLRSWCNDRPRYLYENFSDWDYAHDRQMDQLLKCLHKLESNRIHA